MISRLRMPSAVLAGLMSLAPNSHAMHSDCSRLLQDAALDEAISKSVDILSEKNPPSELSAQEINAQFSTAQDYPQTVVVRTRLLLQMARGTLSAPVAQAFLIHFDELSLFDDQQLESIAQEWRRSDQQPHSNVLRFQSPDQPTMDKMFDRLCRHYWYHALMNLFDQQPYIALQDQRVRDRLVGLIFFPNQHIGSLDILNESNQRANRLLNQIEELDQSIVAANYHLLFNLLDTRTRMNRFRRLANGQYRQGLIESLFKVIDQGAPRSKVQKIAAHIGIYFNFTNPTVAPPSPAPPVGNVIHFRFNRAPQDL